jgi:hypothetical protein
MPQPGALTRAGAPQAALAADALGLLLLPLTIQRAAAAAWLTLHCAGIGNLWRKLYRPAALREAAAAAPAAGGRREAYRVERLTVGALLLTPLLLLAPTLAAFGMLVAALAALPTAARAVLRAGAPACRTLPWESMTRQLVRSLEPRSAGADAWFQPVSGSAGALVLRLCVRT